jgi:hypothetical protein
MPLYQDCSWFLKPQVHISKLTQALGNRFSSIPILVPVNNSFITVHYIQVLKSRSISMGSSTSKYQYSPLEASEIRLIKLKQQDLQDGIFNCDIQEYHFELDVVPTYYALSYVWGDPNDLKTIRINDTYSMSITKNLYDALLHIGTASGIFNESASQNPRPWFWTLGQGHEWKDMFLWVDAICIDQQNSVEKSQQIPHMTRIYSSAFATLVWFGNDSIPTHPKSKFVDIASKLVSRGGNIRSIKLEQELGDGLLRFVLDLVITLQNDWFNRVWVIQEFALSKNSICLPGYFLIETLETLFHEVVKFDDTEETLSMALGIGKTFITHALAMTHAKLLVEHKRDQFYSSSLADRLVILLGAVSNKNCSVPVDYIYGILGICIAPGEDLPPQLKPDYKKPFEKVYQEYAKYIIEQTTLLTILRCEARRLTGVPSWVPDFREIILSQIPQTPPIGNISFSGDGEKLTVEGVRLATVSASLNPGSEDEVIDDLEKFKQSILLPATEIRGEPINTIFQEFLFSTLKIYRLPLQYADQFESIGGFLTQVAASADVGTLKNPTFARSIAGYFIQQGILLFDNGHIGHFIKGTEVEPGDEIWSLKGSSIITILRKSPGNKGHRYIGHSMLFTGVDIYTFDDKFYAEQQVVDVTLI